MLKSDFRGLLLLVVGLCAACSDTIKDGDPWALNMGAPDAGVDASLDIGGTDDADVRRTHDAAVDASVLDAAVDASRADAGPRTITATGWYSSAFEHSGFIEDEDGTFDPNPDGACQAYIAASPPRENWWTWGDGLMPANPLLGTGGTVSRMTLTGELSTLGPHGHLGGYDREFTVESGERHACETAAAFGHCVKPLRPDLCVLPAINDADATKRATLSVTYPGIATAPVSYEARVIFNENVGDGRTDAVVRWSLSTNRADLIPAADLDGLTLSQERYGEGFERVDYDQLDGWVAYSDGNADGWYVSISGVDPATGTSLHVWGWFDVTEVIALP